MELQNLEERIVADGIRDPLVVWGDVLIDGHNRYRIAQKHGLEFRTVQMDFKDKDDAKYWMVQTQLGRRNLTDYQRGELVLKYKPIIAAKAKERQVRKPTDFVPPNLAEQNRTDTRDELAKLAGVSHGTLDKIRKIAETASPELQEQVRSGQKSIDRAYKETFGSKKRDGAKKSALYTTPSVEAGSTSVSVYTPPASYNGGGTKEYRDQRDRIAQTVAELYDSSSVSEYTAQDLAAVHGTSPLRTLRNGRSRMWVTPTQTSSLVECQQRRSVAATKYPQRSISLLFCGRWAIRAA